MYGYLDTPPFNHHSIREARRRTRPPWRFQLDGGVAMPNKGVALDRAGITVFRGITFLAAGPASERSRSGAKRLEEVGSCGQRIDSSMWPLRCAARPPLRRLILTRPPPLAAWSGTMPRPS